MEVVEEVEVSSSIDQIIQTETVPTYDFQCQTNNEVSVASISFSKVSIDDFVNDQKAIQFYTGLIDYLTFVDVLASLGPAAYKLNYLHAYPTISVPDQLFLTIIKCRTYKTNFELSRMFAVSETEVYNIFVTWIKFMSLQWREICIWPDRDIVRFFSPSDFKSKFPETRAIFDGTEFPVKKPQAPAAQQVTFSKYKNRNTAKILVGVTPGGMVSYLSDSYGGSTSDRQITERSNLVRMVDPGDSLMADKGFDVQDIFAPVDVTVNIPTFFKKQNRMAGSTVMRDRKIAAKRVHVERIIGLGKTYKILCHPLNHSEAILSSDISFVCYMLVNFRKCIVPKDA